MSALGHELLSSHVRAMSALPPKADMCGATIDVRFGPKADIALNCNFRIRGAPLRPCFYPYRESHALLSAIMAKILGWMQ